MHSFDNMFRAWEGRPSVPIDWLASEETHVRPGALRIASRATCDSSYDAYVFNIVVRFLCRLGIVPKGMSAVHFIADDPVLHGTGRW